MKYAEPNRYAIETRALLAEAVRAVMGDAPIAPAPVVDLVDDSDLLEVDLAASLLYPACHYPYRQLRDQVAGLSAPQRDEIIDLGFRERGRHDELLREFAAGQRFRFDILMDLGGFRDMHRHRRCVQLLQGFTGRHGWETPEGLGGLKPAFTRAMAAAEKSRAELPEDAQPYLLPLATRTRALFRMDFAEALYIAELRSAPQGHFSYRRVAWEMYQAMARKHPGLARHFRVTDIHTPVDLLKR